MFKLEWKSKGRGQRESMCKVPVAVESTAHERTWTEPEGEGGGQGPSARARVAALCGCGWEVCSGQILPACMLSRFSCAQLFVTPWTAAHQAPWSMGFSRQESWSGLPCSPPGDPPDPGIEPTPPTVIRASGSHACWNTAYPIFLTILWAGSYCCPTLQRRKLRLGDMKSPDPRHLPGKTIELGLDSGWSDFKTHISSLTESIVPGDSGQPEQ